MLTDFAALEPNKKILWAASVVKQGRDQTFFLSSSNGFLSKGLEDDTKPIHFVNKFTETEGGTKCIVPLVLDLSTDGVVGDNKLEGNEEALTSDTQEINLGMIRQAVKNTGRFSDQQSVINFRQSARSTLAFWAADKQDEMFFLIASGNALTKNTNGTTRASTVWSQLPFASQVAAPSTDRVFYPNGVTAEASVTAADTMSWTFLVNAKAQAVTRRIKPIRINGKAFYVVVMHPLQARDLKNSSDYKTVVAQGDTRGDENALFKGSFKSIDGLILHEHNKINTNHGLSSGSLWGASSNVYGATALLMGAQALGYGFIGRNAGEWRESDNTDYGNKSGISIGLMFGIVKNIFKDLYAAKAKRDFSIIALKTACSPS